MVGVEAALEIRVLHRHGKSIREIARETGTSRNTVRRYLRDEEAARYKPRPPRPTKLDPFKAYVIERLGSAAPEWIPASVLLMELRERGYSGGYTMLKMFVASLKPAAGGRAGDPVRDRARRADAGRLGGHSARRATGFRYLSRHWAGAGPPMSSSSPTSGSRR